MSYGWAGTTIEVDLSQGKIEKRQVDPKLVEAYLGGKGTGIKLLWDRVPPEVDALSPDNIFIIGAGTLTGTVVPGASHTCITYKSPVTNTYCYSNIGGFLGTELKHAGYDTIVIAGKSPTPVYLWINNDQVEIRDASHLWGKDTRETHRIIREELKNDKVQMIYIGPAGENKVYYASVEHNFGASASRGGTGTIMGDKNLKAIAVYGTKDISIADPSKLMPLCEHVLSRLDTTRKRIVEASGYTYVRAILRIGDLGYFSGTITPELKQEVKDMGVKAQEYINRTRVREVACANCGLRCKHEYLTPDGEYTFMKCTHWFHPMAATQLLDMDFAMAWANLCEKYGLDTSTMATCVAFAIDLYQKGILTKEDTDGMHLEWKNPEVALALVEKTARREGIGDLLANGTYRAAQQIGKGAEDYAVHSKKLDLPMYGIYHDPHFSLVTAINEKGDPEMLDSGILTFLFGRPREEKEAYIKAGWFPYPKELEEYFLAGHDATEASIREGFCQFVAYDQEQYDLADSVGFCRFWLQYWLYPSINTRTLLADFISATTGMDIDETEATKIAKRIVNLVKAYHVREGLRRKDDTLPKHAFKGSISPHTGKVDPAAFDQLIGRFYEIRGWDSEGIPTKETLQELGLDYVSQDLERRGIFTTPRTSD